MALEEIGRVVGRDTRELNRWSCPKEKLGHTIIFNIELGHLKTPPHLDRSSGHHFTTASREDSSLGNHLEDAGFARRLVAHDNHPRQVVLGVVAAVKVGQFVEHLGVHVNEGSLDATTLILTRLPQQHLFP